MDGYVLAGVYFFLACICAAISLASLAEYMEDM